ncbi:TIGR02677 family protein [Paenibacillus sp. J5C_2022]|uniref:TIGR02677 family protein n=1 Tax=Paenibacillus sp. J5C2022 TaxID=2977129 RepID=UPI0021D11131|nr:TIGR02677 family protein [Paenibacillus sp. J5C2022]MCU6708693.1 TIGR02677 family protein [Paenibacillus sp. J5C2022]
MSSGMTGLPAQSLRGVPELKYINADNLVRYRAIMRFFYQEYKKLRYWLKPEEVYEALLVWKVWPDYTLDMCQNDLNQLVEWQNLTSRHDGGRSSTLEEYLKKKMQYFLRPYSIEIERLLESLEKVTGFGGSLEASLFDTIAEKLFQIRGEHHELDGEQALELWNTLYRSFVSLHENAADYMASLHTARAEEMMVAESFLIFKEKLTDYLQNFVQALQRSAYQIEGNLLRVNDSVRDMFLERVVEGELNKPRLEEAPEREELLDELRQGWTNIRRWFVGEGNSPSELTLLERATKDAIARIVRSAIRIQERKRSGLSRKKELEHLARWFHDMDTVDDAHRLAAFAFGLFPTRHLQGEDLRDSDQADMSSWDERPMIRMLRSRSRKRGSRPQSEPVRNNEERKQREREAFRLKQAEERRMLEEMLRRGRVRISELGVVTTKERLRLLQWISRCMTAGRTHAFVTPEGVRIRLAHTRAVERTVLRSEDGELEMADYELYFTLAEAESLQEAAAATELQLEEGGEVGWHQEQ